MSLRMERVLVLGVGLAAGLAAAPSARAQEAPEPKAPAPLFSRLFQQPTGKNGYEELVRAGDVLRTSKLFRKAEAEPATLGFQRMMLGDRPVTEALRLLQLGLSKSITAPRPVGNTETVPAEYGHFRSLSRLLVMRQYVQLADGRITDAILTARVGLRLGQAVQTDQLLSGMVGIAISAGTLRPLGAHLDQLSVQDCSLLNQVCLEWLNQPSPVIRILETERRSVKSRLAEMRKALQQEADKEGIAEGGAALNAQIAEAEKLADMLFAQKIADQQKPAWTRTSLEFQTDDSLAKSLIAPLLPALQRVEDSYTREESVIRMLACHSAVLRYRWEHNRTPNTLEELNQGDLATDPFTGRLFVLESQGYRYRLYSAGPKTAADDPKAINGRRPVSAVPDEL